MRIIKLQSENIKRLKAVEIIPEGDVVTIGGKNSAGKSSVLDSIAYALGGERLVPSEPIRAGETEAHVVVDLGDLIVTRRFRRDPQPNSLEAFSPTRSTLVVTNKEGARYPSPQALLDKLLGKLTFDPLQFARDEPRKQHETLRALVGLDLTPINERHAEAYQRRALLKKHHEVKIASLVGLPRYPEATVELSMDEISAELLRAEHARHAARDVQRDVSRREVHLKQLDESITHRSTKIQDLQHELALVQKLQLEAIGAQARLTQELMEAREAEVQAVAAIPDTEAIQRRISEIEATNAKVRAEQRRLALVAEADEIAHQINQQHTAVLLAEHEKQQALAAVAYPVPGLGLSEHGVTFNNTPFDQAGAAEQVRVSVAIGIALNPKLKVLMIRNGNLLDTDSFKALTEQAAAADMQLWVEVVSESKDGVGVMLVDGEVAE